MSDQTEEENYHDANQQTKDTDSEDGNMKVEDSETSETVNSTVGEMDLNGRNGADSLMESFMNEERQDACTTKALLLEDKKETENDTVSVVKDAMKNFLEQYSVQNLNQTSQSLREIQGYCSDSSSDSSSDEDSEEDSESSDSDSEDEVEEDVSKTNKRQQKAQEKSWLSVLGLDNVPLELPDISSLDLNDEEFIHMGMFENVIEKIVTVIGLPQMPAYDLDTLLFLEEGKKVLGYVADVMGPVTSPCYIITMTSTKMLEDLQLRQGTKVYCAPKSKYTKYVVLQELMNIPGSDASWVGDREVPSEFQDFSDDEQERATRTSRNKVKRKHSQEYNADITHKMERLPVGRANVAQTATLRSLNSTPAERTTQLISSPPNFSATMYRPPNHAVVNPFAFVRPNSYNFPMIPVFNPSIPPPNFRSPQFFEPELHRFPPYFGVNTPSQNFNPRRYM